MPSVPPACVQTLFIFSYALKCPSTPSSHLQVGPTHHPLPLSPLVLLFLRRGGLPHRASCSQPPGPARRASCSPPLGPVRRASSCPPPPIMEASLAATQEVRHSAGGADGGRRCTDRGAGARRGRATDGRSWERGSLDLGRAVEVQMSGSQAGGARTGATRDQATGGRCARSELRRQVKGQMGAADYRRTGSWSCCIEDEEGAEEGDDTWAPRLSEMDEKI